MTTKQILRKITFVVLTLAACSGLVVLLVAAIGKRNHELCKDYSIAIKGNEKSHFITSNDIEKMLTAATGGQVKDAPISGFNLRKVEQQLRGNAWVQDADLYFDNKDVLHVSIQEKDPIARVFTATGKSFYIDSAATQMPLSPVMSARVPVFTNFPDKKFLSTKDSALLNDIKRTAAFILRDSFWMAQTEQLDITGDRNFEMVPTIGNHIVRLGNGDDIDKKFHRLLVFYQQVMGKTGFEKYKIVDVRFGGQVVATKEKISKVDSIQLRKNVEKLLREARQMQQDTVMTTGPGKDPTTLSTNADVKQTMKIQEQNNSNPGDARSSGTTVKTGMSAKPKLIEQKTSEKKSDGKKPKALMPATP